MKKFLPQSPKQAILADALCWFIAASVACAFSPTIGGIIAIIGGVAITVEIVLLNRMNNQPISEEDFD